MKKLEDVFKESLLDDEDEIDKTTREEVNWLNLMKGPDSFRKHIRRIERVLKRKGTLCKVDPKTFELKNFKGYNHYIAIYHFQNNIHHYTSIICNDGEVDTVVIYNGWKDEILGPIYRGQEFCEFVQVNEIDEVYIVPEELEWLYDRILKNATKY